MTDQELRNLLQDMSLVWEPGEIQVFIGHDSRVCTHKTFCLAE